MRDATATGAAYGATVHIGPTATPGQERAIREQEAAEAEAALRRLEIKAEGIHAALDAARTEAARLRQRAQEGAG